MATIGQILESGNMREMIRQRDDAMRMLAIVCVRAGGELSFTPGELTFDHQVERHTDPATGIVKVTAVRGDPR